MLAVTRINRIRSKAIRVRVGIHGIHDIVEEARLPSFVLSKTAEDGEIETCVEKESVLNLTQNQVINLTHVGLGGTFSGCTFTKTRKGKGWLRCNHVRRFRSARERWWFLAVSNCNATKGLDVRYKFLMTNGQPGDYWHYHFSADEFSYRGRKTPFTFPLIPQPPYIATAQNELNYTDCSLSQDSVGLPFVSPGKNHYHIGGCDIAMTTPRKPID
uniref:(California timema) hypothetical protein n=1 Tax=Timema californicum TaxID=61474 RepID=A0A7R9IXX8_TIMCA|nr:unnamed protein product [Timema californicum]